MFSPKLSTAAFTDQTIGRSYDGAITRLVRIEAKAVGLLTVIAIAAAVTSAALTFENWWARGVGAVSMTYLAFASWGAMRMLRMASYEQVLSATALEPDGGRAATAAAASVIESMSPTHSNNVVGAIADLRVGGATALVALVLAVFGIAETTSKPAEPTQETTVDVVTSTTTPGAGVQGAGMVPTTVSVTTTTTAAASSTSVDVPAEPSR